MSPSGDRSERERVLDAGLRERVAVEAEAGDLVAAEVDQAPERVGVLVDDRDGVSVVLKALGEGRPHPAASHDHEVHSAARYTVDGGSARCLSCDGPPAGLALRIVSDLSDAAKRLLLGRPVRSDLLGHTLLPKRIALPVFASDALSSVAYAPDEILLTLSLAGTAALVVSPWVGLAVVFVMVVVVASYRQNVHAYPSGGGDYEVATTNLGPNAGVTVASALLVDYVLTVAVSISSGAQYAATAFPPLRGHEAAFAVGLVVLRDGWPTCAG